VNHEKPEPELCQPSAKDRAELPDDPPETDFDPELDGDLAPRWPNVFGSNW
jgi:hypothetical protein